MEAQTETVIENPQVQSEPSRRISGSEFEAARIEMMERELLRSGRKVGKTQAETEAAYIRLREERENAKQISEHKRERAVARDANAIIADGLSKKLLANGVDPAGMSLEQLKEHAEKIDRMNQQKEEAQRLLQERKRREQRAAELFESSCCPKRHTLKLESLDAQKNPKWIATRDLLVKQATFANGFIVALLGVRGCGKTEMVTSVFEQLSKLLITCRYVKAKDLIWDIFGAYTQAAKGERGQRIDDAVQRWLEYDVLAIDDLHQRKFSDAEQDILTNLLDHYYDRMQCVILIANQDKDQFSESMGDSVTSRIHEIGEAIVCDWPSYRVPGKWRQDEGSPLRIPSGSF